MMTSALQRTETERWGRGISLLAPASIWPRFEARLIVRLTGVPECPLGLSHNPSDNGTPERVSLPRHMALA